MNSPPAELLHELAQQCSVDEKGGGITVGYFMNDRVLVAMWDVAGEKANIRVMTQDWREACHTAASYLVMAQAALAWGKGWDALQAKEDVWQAIIDDVNTIVEEMNQERAKSHTNA